MNTQTDLAGKWELVGALVGLARALEGKLPSADADRLILSGLSAASAGSPLTSESQKIFLELIHKEKRQAAPDCAACQSPCGRTADYDMKELLTEAPGLFTGKFLLLQSLCAVAVLANPLASDSEEAEEALRFLYDGLFMLGYAYEPGLLEPLLHTAGSISRKLVAAAAAAPEQIPTAK